MESTRQKKFARVIQKELSTIFQRESGELFPGSLVTITTIRMTPDLGLARIHLSIIPAAGSSPQGVVNSIKAQSREIRYSLGKLIKNQVRVIPEMEFFLDDTLDYVERMDKLFKDLNKEEEHD